MSPRPTLSVEDGRIAAEKTRQTAAAETSANDNKSNNDLSEYETDSEKKAILDVKFASNFEIAKLYVDRILNKSESEPADRKSVKKLDEINATLKEIITKYHYPENWVISEEVIKKAQAAKKKAEMKAKEQKEAKEAAEKAAAEKAAAEKAAAEKATAEKAAAEKAAAEKAEAEKAAAEKAAAEKAAAKKAAAEKAAAEKAAARNFGNINFP
ncbi:hypothetical protein B0O99DRAFT_695315 [Bisporella sp. PMI_857]|nr:hypothetical protein B0O99DRAFT_695315 [Bisporella sp. PMI_857]